MRRHLLAVAAGGQVHGARTSEQDAVAGSTRLPTFLATVLVVGVLVGLCVVVAQALRRRLDLVRGGEATAVWGCAFFPAALVFGVSLAIAADAALSYASPHEAMFSWESTVAMSGVVIVVAAVLGVVAVVLGTSLTHRSARVRLIGFVVSAIPAVLFEPGITLVAVAPAWIAALILSSALAEARRDLSPRSPGPRPR